MHVYIIMIIMKVIFPPSYHHNGFLVTYALGQMVYGYTYYGRGGCTYHIFYDYIYYASCLVC